MKILITGGGCREYIDSVRVVTNSSSGRTSAELAEELFAKGFEVTLITAKSAIKPQVSSINMRFFETGEELAVAIRKELTSCQYDAVIHAAAVSDFVPETIQIAGETIKAGKNAKKLPSGGEMTVTFKASPKIADSLHEWAKIGGNANAKVVCFKLLNNADEEAKTKAVSSLFGHSKADFVVYNDLSQITKESHPFKILKTNGECVATGNTNAEMADALCKVLEKL
ncbi:phosphopantothenoylcysteine decarboxylase [uncultured Treponema sp.]|uniref:phosphopantothenoylcysteine decarboxylase domain-containing protein n=1 Tax=uncultured Treponema sp. TaxID=162155 RepID=UPI0025E110B8|nr:phosphopantothenoylcysteine decarboxylase [uncultured Treponema sp.]